MTGKGTATGTARDHLATHHLSRAIVVLEPWLAALGVIPLGLILHKAFGHGLYWAGTVMAGLLLTWFAVSVTHDKSRHHRGHIAATGLVLTTWTVQMQLTGSHPSAWFAWLIAVGGVAASWGIKGHTRNKAQDAVLAALLGQAADDAGIAGAQFTIQPAKPGAKVIRATAVGRPGEHTGQDFVERSQRLASGAGLPPGAITASPNANLASAADVRISDPRVLDRPALWPGPSAPGRSIADPLRIGLWQDGEPEEYPLLHGGDSHHLLIAGTTGSAKSTGGGWTLLGELVTRTEVAVYAVDVTKGRQTLGPYEGCLAGLITDTAQAEPFLDEVRSWIKPRTDYLASRGLHAWRPGCGIDFLVVWLEEAPDILDALSDAALDRWCSSLKAARSAGIMFVWSGQRPDWSQMPTIARAQLNAHMVFGVADGKDADLCMSGRQDRAGCLPENWGARHAGKHYLDAPHIDDAHVAMAARTFYWGPDDTVVRAHAAKHPRTSPALILPATAPAQPRPEEADDMAEDRIDPDAAAEEELGPNPDGPIDPASSFAQDVTDWEWDDGEPEEREAPVADPEAALDMWLDERLRTDPKFRAGDLIDLRSKLGRSRSWMYEQLAARARAGRLEQGDRGNWTVRQAS